MSGNLLLDKPPGHNEIIRRARCGAWRAIWLTGKAKSLSKCLAGLMRDCGRRVYTDRLPAGMQPSEPDAVHGLALQGEHEEVKINAPLASGQSFSPA